jgi:Flp pilus assembly pilin Flp
MIALMEFFRRLRGEKGQTTIEYILVIVLIALVIVFAFQSSAIESAINLAVNKIADAINSAPSPPEPNG